MMRGCSANRGRGHQFDKTTHRCKCGRWERGYKPKVEPVRPRDECQICECEQAIDRYGFLVHHGYKRPGCGYITGDCMGVGHKPYPETDALERYLIAVRTFIAGREARLAELPTLTEWTYTYTKGYGQKKETKTRLIVKGDEYKYDYGENQPYPSFADAIRLAMGKVEADLKFARQDEARVVARIANAPK